MNTSSRTRQGRGGNSRRTFSNGRPSAGGRRFSRTKTSHRSRGRSGSRGGSRSRGSKQPTFNPSMFINTNPVEEKTNPYTPQNSFSDFGLNKNILKTLSSMSITSPTPIQDQIIQEVMNGRDVIGLAETGTGKTAAFLLPLIEKTCVENKRQTLILAPTRELAIQIEDELKKLSRGLRIFSVTCVGGVNINPQIRALKRMNHFVIGTPGRVLDLIKRKNFDPSNVTTVVLDEADRMLDMGFIGDIRTILSYTPDNRETLFFSATMERKMEDLVKSFLNNPVRVSVKKKDVTNSIEQDIVAHGHHNKFDTLTKLLSDRDFSRVIVFGAMKHSVEKLSRELSRSGVKSTSIHGNKSHGQRQRALNDFKKGVARVLVATDVAARGIHVDNVSHVINYDLPNTFEDYVHRIGRTGRAKKKGKALTFIPQK